MGAMGAIGGQPDGHLLSPLSTSPFDQTDRSHPRDMLTPAGASVGSITGSPFGTPAMQNNASGFYPLSMTMNPAAAAAYGQVDSVAFLGSHPSSFGSYSQSASAVPGFQTTQGGQEDNASKLPSDPLVEKRRRRRESHNAVERRRRDHINEKIQELCNLLPEFAADAQNKPNKGIVLRRSVDYIRNMQIFAAKQMERTMELEAVMLRLIQQHGIAEADLGLSVPLGTRFELPNIVATLTHEELDQDMA
eukprot:jgi/Hompol1/6198/HPOL_000610-RA